VRYENDFYSSLLICLAPVELKSIIRYRPILKKIQLKLESILKIYGFGISIDNTNKLLADSDLEENIILIY
jgi:hypothetical protein